MPNPGSFDFDEHPPPLWGDALVIRVAKYTAADVEKQVERKFEVLPNVRCMRIDNKEGPEVPVARFAYIMDDTLDINFGWPSQFEQLWPMDARGPYVVKNDDRLVVYFVPEEGEDAEPTFYFDGFAQIPQVDVSPDGQAVTFAAVGVAARAFDTPILGRTQRNSSPDNIDITSGSEDVRIDAETRFNPADQRIGTAGGYVPNAVKQEKWTSTDPGSAIANHPVFLEPSLQRKPDPREYWTISGAICYLLARYNQDEEFVKNPRSEVLLEILKANYPATGREVIDPEDPDSFESFDIQIRDYDATGKCWPNVVSDFLSYGGFVMKWKLTTDTDAEGEFRPKTELVVFRRDAFVATLPKKLYLDSVRAPIDPALNNITQIHLARDANQIVNSYGIETAARQVEISVVLALAVKPDSEDKTIVPPLGNIPRGKDLYKLSNKEYLGAKARRKYRWYVADECGDGHYAYSIQAGAVQGTEETKPFDFSDIFPPDDADEPTYVERYRPGHHTVIAKDDLQRPRRATLAVSFDYLGTCPRLWDGTGKWYDIPHGWELLHDRLGILVNVEDPDDWQTGNQLVPMLRGITMHAAPPNLDAVPPPLLPLRPFWLRLTTAIDDDAGLPGKLADQGIAGIVAPKRIASPTKFVRFRQVDGKDHFQYCTIARSSSNYKAADGNGTDPVIVRDDTDAATAHANQIRAAHEFPTLAGSATIPFITQRYELGDRLSAIKGRSVSLQVNAATEQGEAPEYPWIVAVSWVFENDRQQTQLVFSDLRAVVQRWRG